MARANEISPDRAEAPGRCHAARFPLRATWCSRRLAARPEHPITRLGSVRKAAPCPRLEMQRTIIIFYLIEFRNRAASTKGGRQVVAVQFTVEILNMRLPTQRTGPSVFFFLCV